MSKIKKFMKSPAFAVVLFIVAAGLIAASTIGGARAALLYSAEYKSELELHDIGVTLKENGDPVSYRNYQSNSDDKWNTGGAETLLTGLLGKDEEGNEEKFVPGRVYDEVISVENSGNIPEYVRVSVTKYWSMENDKGEEVKLTKLSPKEIELIGPEKHGWVKDEKASSSPERDVYYYTGIVEKGKEATLCDGIRVDSEVLNAVTIHEEKVGKYTKYTKTYDYNGIKFNIEVKADAVQTHNGAHAIKSAWGRDVTISGSGTLSLD